MSRFTIECRELIRVTIRNYLSLEDIDSLCFTQRINFSNLKGSTIDEKARSLIVFFESNNDAEGLVNLLKRERPNIPWCEDFVDDFADIHPNLREITASGKRAVETIYRLNKIMAESRILELEITTSMFSQIFTRVQQDQMLKHINELKQIMKDSDLGA